ncbi:SET domain-containing protein, partial [Clavulina sp. PMI_390]
RYERQTDIPDGWALMEYKRYRDEERVNGAKSEGAMWRRLYYLFRFGAPLVKLEFETAVLHFRRPDECNCREHKLERIGYSESDVQRSSTIVEIYAGKEPYPERDLIELRESSIARVGAFAARDLPKEQILGSYTGEIISDVDLDIRVKEYTRARTGEYVFTIPGKKGRSVDATFSRCSLKYLNHSCDPNCYVVWDSRKQKMVYSTRYAIDYGFTVDEDYPDEKR